MPQFRFRATTSEGKILQKEFEAPDKKRAKERVQKLANARSLKIQSIDEKRVFSIKLPKTVPNRLKVNRKRTRPRK